MFFRKITNLHLVEKTEEEIALQSHWFDNFIMFAITVSSILLALESPLNDPDGTLAKVLLVFDYSTTVIFTLEVVVKVIASGFLCNGDKSYLKNSWNVADFLIVVISIVSLLPLEANLSVLKVIRMIRLLRPLRVISKNENLKLSIQALVVATPAIMSLLVIFLLVMFIFGIIAVNLFKGKSFDCDVSNIVGLGQKEIERLIETKQDCLNYGGTWMLKHYHFDNIQTAVMNMVIMSQTVNWAPMMYSIVNSGGPEHVSGFKNTPLVAIFFIVFIIFGAFFMTNLFVGVVINAFNKESDRLGKDFLLTDKQKSWI
jgi:voltage-dependent calcium channel T type alpha-1G